MKNNCVQSFSLENKTILVTSASSGIGELLQESSKMGANRSLLPDAMKERLKETHAQMEGNQPDYIVADLSNSDDVQKFK